MRVSHDRQERIETQCDERRHPADAEQRDHEGQQRERGDRLEHTDSHQLDLAEEPVAGREEPERQSDGDGHGQ